MKKIYLSPPHLTDDAIEYLKDAVASNWIAPVGPHVDGFERELASLLDVSHVVSANSGTSAIHLALLALDVGRGDEVICSTFTYCASANPIIYCGAEPVFVDSEADTWNLDPSLLEEAIADRIKKKGKKPKAIIVVHLYGMPARMNKIMAVAARYGVAVVEDAAEALGSTYCGQPAGTFGDIGILSFNGNKIITTSGGGALISNNCVLAERARYFRQEARDPVPYYEHRSVGYNYRLSNLLAAVGRSQLLVLEERIKRKREIFNFYYTELGTIPGIVFNPEPQDMKSNRWLSTVLFQRSEGDCERVRLILEKNDIESRRLWKPMHRQPVFKGFPAYVTGVSDHLFAHGLCLPSGTSLEDSDIMRIATLLKNELQ